MTRPLRIQYPGALYHVTSRGDRKALIFRDDTDRAVWLQLLGEVCGRFGYAVHAFCMMGNHYHLLVETINANPALGMRHLNGVYAQYFNRRHDLVGHVFQGRYHAVLIEKEAHLLELARYIVLNPVRAQFVTQPQHWRWSSFNFTVAVLPPPSWLETDWLLSKFGPNANAARAAYHQFVLNGLGISSPLQNIYRQLMLGSAEFIRQHQQTTFSDHIDGVSRQQRGALALPLQAYRDKFPGDRNTAMAAAYQTNAYTITAIARAFGVSHATASRAIRQGLPLSSCRNDGPDPGV
ncbi:addiction module toxin RelE [Duganella sp. CY15W]|uniref:transposase n=1 Tax=Duganella sp. CY15W TaxID=2692172 RepID=UPI00136F758E|nr:transposase [Duganella sp. CY15W]MYM28495.1 addiction module toxin RelE [Duganella sp. CY15W]